MSYVDHTLDAVVVGASGTVGRLLLPHWRTAPQNFLLQHRSFTKNISEEFDIFWEPLLGPADLERSLESSPRPKSMVVLAGITPASGRDLAQNKLIAESCLAAAKRVGIPRVLIASTSAVYGNYLQRPFSEDDKPIPVNPYGEAKLIMEEASAAWASDTLEVCCLRIGNVAGADALLRQFSERQKKEIQIDIYANGRTPERSYIGPGTLAKTLLELAKFPKPLPAVLNVASPEPVSMQQLADAAGLRWTAVPRQGTDGQRITLDCNLIWSIISPTHFASEPSEMVRQLVFSRKMK